MKKKKTKKKNLVDIDANFDRLRATLQFVGIQGFFFSLSFIFSGTWRCAV